MDVHPASHPTNQTLSSFGLGKLDDGLAAAVNRHLEQCPDSRKRVAEMSADSFLGHRWHDRPRTGNSLMAAIVTDLSKLWT